MINYGRTKSATMPQPIEYTNTSVFVASNISPYEETINDTTQTGYEYDYVSYTKDEYIDLISAQNQATIATLQEELQATKILLGVE